MRDNKVNIYIMAGVFAALIAGYLCWCFFLKGHSQPVSYDITKNAPIPSNLPPLHPTGPGNAPTPGSSATPAGAGHTPPPAMTPPVASNAPKPGTVHPPATPMATPMAGKSPGVGKPAAGNAKMASGKPAPATGGKPGTMPPANMFSGKPAVPQGPMLPHPPPPTIKAPQPIAAVFDPFQGGPNPPPKPPPPPPVIWPQMVMASTLPPMLPEKSLIGNYQPLAIQAEPPVGRMAGWIYNNGQIIAIFEDVDGITRSLRVGDPVGNLTVKTITPEYMVMVDENGVKHTLKLQGLDSYAGKSRTVNVVATPAPAGTPAWHR